MRCHVMFITAVGLFLVKLKWPNNIRVSKMMMMMMMMMMKPDLHLTQQVYVMRFITDLFFLYYSREYSCSSSTAF